MDKLIKIGQVSKPHGIKGGGQFYFSGKDYIALSKGMRVYSSKDEADVLTVKSFDEGNKIIVYFEEIKDRTELESVLPVDIYIDTQLLPALSDDDFYYFELVGFAVKDTSGEKLGEIMSVYDNGIQDVIQYKSEEGELLDVLLIDNFVQEIKKSEKEIIIIPPELV